MATVEQIIATINPDRYFDKKNSTISLKEFKELIKKEGFQKAAEKAKPKPAELPGVGTSAEHLIRYNSPVEQLEPLYFWVLDFMADRLGLDVEKLADNFVSSPGSGHFSELGGKSTAMQQQAQKILADINTVLRSVLNIVYDLKEFKIRLQHYDHLKSRDKSTQDASRLALKQIWMDKVDIQKGAGSINAMTTGQLGFQTLRDAFLAIEDESLKLGGKELDLNDRVKRILRPRIQEFNVWAKESEGELRKRYELERNYLRSQLNSLQLYSRWIKPYLKATAHLEGGEMGTNAALVKTFNTIYLELSLFAKSKIYLPEEHGMVKGGKLKRNYYKCVLVDFTFRGTPQRIAQRGDYSYGGKTDIKFKAYGLNEDEINKLKKELAKSEIGDLFKLISGVTDESLGQIQEEIDSFLAEKEEEEEKSKPKDTSNPFAALFGAYN